MEMANRCFTQNTFDFLSALAANNRHEWLDGHKSIYGSTVRYPCRALDLRF